MAGCDKCWGDAYTRSRCNGREQADVYAELLKERDASGHTCTPEQQRRYSSDEPTPTPPPQEEESECNS